MTQRRTTKRATRKAALNPVQELPSSLQTAYSLLDGTGLTPEERAAFKGRIEAAAKARIEKGGLFFTEKITPQQAATPEGAIRVRFFSEVKMNNEELSILTDLQKKGISIVTNEERNKLIQARVSTLTASFKDKGVYNTLVAVPDKFTDNVCLFLALGKYVGTFDYDTVFFSSGIGKKGETHLKVKRGEFVEDKLIATVEIDRNDEEGLKQFAYIKDRLSNVYNTGLAQLILDYSVYEVLRSRSFTLTMKDDSMLAPILNCCPWNNSALLKDFKKYVAFYVQGNKSKSVSLTKYSSLVHAPLALLKEVSTVGSEGKKRMSSVFTRLTGQMLANRSDKDISKRVEYLAKNDNDFSHELAVIDKKGKSNEEKLAMARKALNSNDYLALSSTALTLFEVILEEVGKNPKAFGGTVYFQNYQELAEKCGVKEPGTNFSGRIKKAIEELTVWRKFVTSDRKKIYRLPLISAIVQDKGKNSFGLTIHQFFNENYIKTLYTPNHFYLLTADTAKVMAFYANGKYNKYRPEKNKRTTKITEMPKYTLLLIEVIKYMLTFKDGNTKIGKRLLLKKMGLDIYLQRSRANEAEWRLKEALAAVKEGGFIESYTTQTGVSGEDKQEDIIFNFKLNK